MSAHWIVKSSRKRPAERFLICGTYTINGGRPITIVQFIRPMPGGHSYSRESMAKFREAGCKNNEILVSVRLEEKSLKRLMKRSISQAAMLAAATNESQPDLFAEAG